MNGKGDCAKENDNISFVNGKSPAAHTQQIQSRDSDDNADPELYPRLLMQKQGKDRNQNDIHRCDKSGLSHRRVLNTDLLQIAGYKQYHTGRKTPPVRRVFRCASPGSPALPARRQSPSFCFRQLSEKLRSPAAEKPCQKRS